MMDRRAFLKLAGISLALGPALAEFVGASPVARPLEREDASDFSRGVVPDTAIKDQLMRTRFFDHWFKDDIVLSEKEKVRLATCLLRLKRLQGLVGFGNFCLMGFDEARAYAKSHAQVGEFTRADTDFMEKIFYDSARGYGFMGEKPIKKMTGEVRRNKTTKIKGTGNYLYKGQAVKVYQDILQKVGTDAVLTSGIRGVMKQFLLFLDKANDNGGNLSLASRSLAPPGYSFHGVGDFDVGERGFGIDNFTEKFTDTRLYKRLTDLGYVRFRYARDNHLGVRFEPWHVEVD